MRCKFGGKFQGPSEGLPFPFVSTDFLAVPFAALDEDPGGLLSAAGLDIPAAVEVEAAGLEGAPERPALLGRDAEAELASRESRAFKASALLLSASALAPPGWVVDKDE